MRFLLQETANEFDVMAKEIFELRQQCDKAR